MVFAEVRISVHVLFQVQVQELKHQVQPVVRVYHILQTASPKVADVNATLSFSRDLVIAA